MIRRPWLWVLICLLLAGLLAVLAPFERTLEANARLVYFHGAWVWVGLLALLLLAAWQSACSWLAWQRRPNRTAK
jgi:hypothetical protein